MLRYLFLFSKNIQELINYCMELGIFFVFAHLNHVSCTCKFLLMCLVIFNLVGGLVFSTFVVCFIYINIDDRYLFIFVVYVDNIL